MKKIGYFTNHNFIKSILSASLLAVILSGCGGDSDAPMSLTLLHINDHHSRLDEETTTLKLSNAAGVIKSVTMPMGGFARVAAAIKEESANEANVIKLHAGDALTGDLYFTQSEGEADAIAMNSVCFDAMTFGNHEFDTGDSGLSKFIGFLNKDVTKCQTSLLSSNVSTSSTSPIAGKFQPFTTVVRGGQKIGIVGVTISQKTKNHIEHMQRRPVGETTCQTAQKNLQRRALGKLRTLRKANLRHKIRRQTMLLL